MICSEECTSAGCWGAGPEQCLECRHFKFNDTCLRSCHSQPNIYQMDAKQCRPCHSECKLSCSGPDAGQCLECVHVRDGKYCVPKCPETKYPLNGVCVKCHETCVGCTGPNNTIGPNGCTSCDKAIINGDKVEKCLKKNEQCPGKCLRILRVHAERRLTFHLFLIRMKIDGYYYEWVIPQEQGILKPLAGKAICRKCHPRCDRCTGYGFHVQVCQKCAGYKRGEQCEDECPPDHYADEMHRECFACYGECRGCTGPGANQCLKCRNLKIFDGEPSANSTTFNCTDTCTNEYPHKVYTQVEFEPYCSQVSPYTEPVSQPETARTSLYLAIVFIVLLLLFGVLIMSTLHCRQQAKTKKETLNMTRAMVGLEDSAEPLHPSSVGANLSRFQVIKEMELRRGPLIGSGAFGEVSKGIWVPESQNVTISVAIKVLKNMNHSYSASKEFLDEAYIMASVNHANILPLLGVCMTSEMMLITQLMPCGSLLDYVIKNKAAIGSQTLLNWSTQIACGMAYLEKKGLVHRDLAARNVLVQNRHKVKISDFGLAKLLSETNEYKAAGGKMPIKWLALECIRHRLFTTKSDVWAFGVTIWELLTFGCRPYEHIPAKDLPDKIESGEKLEQPSICSLDLYCALLACWHIDSESRPTFKQLVVIFQGFAKDPGRYLAIEGDKFLRSPQYVSSDEKEMMRILAQQQASDPIVDGGDYLMTTKRSAGPSTMLQPLANGAKFSLKKYSGSSDGRKPGDDEIDSTSHEVSIGNIRLDLPLDEDDYLMPTSQSQSAAPGGYMDLIGTPICVDNPEYLLGSTNTPTVLAIVSNQPNSPPPTQTIGIPVIGAMPMIEGEPTSDHEYYNDLQRELQPLQRELQPLQRNETTV